MPSTAAAADGPRLDLSTKMIKFTTVQLQLQHCIHLFHIIYIYITITLYLHYIYINLHYIYITFSLHLHYIHITVETASQKS